MKEERAPKYTVCVVPKMMMCLIQHTLHYIELDWRMTYKNKQTINDMTIRSKHSLQKRTHSPDIWGISFVILSHFCN